ncbi:NAD(P)/FAD-dependent oxidoreductase [Thiomonas intermedia]|uniref:NAD(P)/FAD-dependent oxidoreductase n=1 Tax=Thiomonas intermedia TaxID=926 RepID=UPI0009A52873|nr:NAD(P)/FAD-dependent oxidoreductase [Thiomonas intermedia]
MKEQLIAAGDSEARHQVDVLVIGGGPAGTTAATQLQTRGFRVALLEKDHHPRFHIGESLLPANLPLLEKLGVADDVKAIAMEKWGAEFVSPWHAQETQTFAFAEAWDKSMPMAYQVRRSEFDEILMRNTRSKGVDVREGCKVDAVEFLPGGEGAIVSATHEDGRHSTWQARQVVDASGRDTVLGSRFRTKTRNPRHNSAALYAHFSGARRLDGKAQGNISIFWFEHGWFWFIPLADGTTSVGAVVWPYYLKRRDKPLEAFFADTLAMSPALSARLADATRVSAVEATGNFSYSCSQTHGPNYVLIGDAFAFIDPVFSSGVMLAMQGGFFAADALETCLRQPAKASQALALFDRQMRHGPRAFSWFIYRVNHPTMRDLFMGPRNVLRVKEALLSVLAGDIFGRTPIWPSIAVLKAIFYAASLKHLGRTLAARALRKRQIQVHDDLQTEMRQG